MHATVHRSVEKNLPKNAGYDVTLQSLKDRKKYYGLNGKDYRSYCPNLRNVPQPIPPQSNVNTTDLAS